MQNTKATFVLILVWLGCFTPVFAQDRLTIVIPTVEDETEYIWNNLRDIEFFESNNYQLSLPKGSIIDRLKQKSKAGQLADSDYDQLERFMADSVYDVRNYLKGYQKVKDELVLMNQLLNQLDTLNFKWSFKTFKRYTVKLTLYGPGGSFNPEDGSLILFTTPMGGFKNYTNPANTIIHEIVHIGIEESIISKYQVPHALKERIVDTFVYLYFKSNLPEYQIQDMGEYRLDPYLKETEDFDKLNMVVSCLLQE